MNIKRTVVMTFHHPEYPEELIFRPAMVEAMQEYDAYLNSEAYENQRFRCDSITDTDPFRASNGVVITFMVPAIV